MEISNIKQDLLKAELDLEKLRNASQQQIFVDALKISQEFNNSVASSNKLVTELKAKLKGVVLVTQDCKPSQEFINLWNASSAR